MSFNPKEFNYIASGITDHLRSTLPSTILLNVVPRQKSEQIKNVLGYSSRGEVIHANNMVISENE